MTPEPGKSFNDSQQNSTPTEDIIRQISELEKVSLNLEPDVAFRNEISTKASSYVNDYLDSLANMKAYVDGECAHLKSLKVGDNPKQFDDLLAILKDEVNRVGINSSSGAGFAYVPSGGIWASSVADMLAAATNRYAGVYFSSPGAVIIENQMIRWLSSIAGYPQTAHGNLTSGGSIANLTAIQTARDKYRIDSTNVKKAVIYFTGHAHHCIHKAVHILGLDEIIRRTVRMDSEFRMDSDNLEEMMHRDVEEGLHPFLVVATAGTTDTGAIDPLEKIADLCEKFGAWFHVDAAYGGFFMLLEETRKQFKGVERSNSLVMDPHKGIFLPFGVGAVLVRDGKALLESNLERASYMQDALGYDEISPADSGIELTRHFRGLRMWLPLHLHGVNAFRANLREKLLLARYFYGEIKDMGFETGPEPELSIVLFRYPGNDKERVNKQLLDLIRVDGKVLFSSTTINGEFWIRCAIMSFRSHLREIRLALDVIGENVKKVR